MNISGIKGIETNPQIKTQDAPKDGALLVFLLQVKAADITQKGLKSYLLQNEVSTQRYELNKQRIDELLNNDIKSLKTQLKDINAQLKAITEARAAVKGGTATDHQKKLAKTTLQPLVDKVDSLQNQIGKVQQNVGQLQSDNESVKNQIQENWSANISSTLQLVQSAVKQASIALQRLLKENGVKQK